MTDLAVVTQDPRYGGGGAAQLAAFLTAARALGRDPRTFYGLQPGLAGRPHDGALAGTGVPMPMRGLHAVNELVAARRLAPAVGAAGSVWAVATTADHCLAAPRSGRPYACWIGTSLADEWRGRRHGLGPARRAFLEAGLKASRRLETSVLRGAARLFATSPASRAGIAAAARLDPSAVGILPIPVDVARFTPLPDEEWLSLAERPTLVFVGRAGDPRKNVALLLDAFRLIRSARPEARLLLVGEPPAAAALPAGVEAAGYVDDLPAVLRRCTLLVLPSWQEGFGIVAAEALACGVPVLTTPCGGPEELVRASDGGVVLSGFDAEELAASAQALLAEPASLVSRRAAARDHLERSFSPAALADRLGAALGLPREA